MFEKTENKRKRGRGWPIFKKELSLRTCLRSFQEFATIMKRLYCCRGSSTALKYHFESPPGRSVPSCQLNQRIRFSFTYILKMSLHYQCDQIGQFIELWATFEILLQHLICPNLPHSYAIFNVNVSKSIIFLVKSFFGNFY